MTLLEGLTSAIVVICIFGGFGYVILTKMSQSGHPLIPRIKEWLAPKVPEVSPIIEGVQQIYPERRTMI